MTYWNLFMRFGYRTADQLMADKLDIALDRYGGKVCLDFKGMEIINDDFQKWLDDGLAKDRFAVEDLDKVGIEVEWEGE